LNAGSPSCGSVFTRARDKSGDIQPLVESGTLWDINGTLQPHVGANVVEKVASAPAEPAPPMPTVEQIAVPGELPKCLSSLSLVRPMMLVIWRTGPLFEFSASMVCLVMFDGGSRHFTSTTSGSYS